MIYQDSHKDVYTDSVLSKQKQIKVPSELGLHFHNIHTKGWEKEVALENEIQVEFFLNASFVIYPYKLVQTGDFDKT